MLDSVQRRLLATLCWCRENVVICQNNDNYTVAGHVQSARNSIAL